jgi:hypothetical protein
MAATGPGDIGELDGSLLTGVYGIGYLRQPMVFFALAIARA